LSKKQPAGASPTRELADAVSNSKAVFVFFTTNSILLETRDWIVFELGVAVSKGIPIYCWKQSSLNKAQLPRLLGQVTTYRDFEIYNTEGTIKLTEEVRRAAKAL
jgi:nucleoside 2-deoxyribosyltransferase